MGKAYTGQFAGGQPAPAAGEWPVWQAKQEKPQAVRQWLMGILQEIPPKSVIFEALLRFI